MINAVLLSHGTALCPVCGDSFPLHCEGAVVPCPRCNAGVNVSAPQRQQLSPAEQMRAQMLQANDKYLQALREGTTTTTGDGDGDDENNNNKKKKKKEDTRQTEDALCEKCNKVTKCFTYALQIRGADEGQTIFYECGVCRNTWSLNS